MAMFNVIILLGLSIYAAHLNVGYKWKTLMENSLPEVDPRPWWQRAFHIIGLHLSFEAFWRTLFINVTFAGASMAAVINGYKGDNAFDFWMNPWTPFFLCAIVGVWSQKWVKDDVLDSIAVSGPAIFRVVTMAVLTALVYFYAAYLSIGYASWWKPVP